MFRRAPSHAKFVACSVVLIVGMGTVSACGSTGGNGSSSGGDLTVALSSDPDALDPTLSATVTGRAVLINMCEGLYDVDSSASIVPKLAAAMPVYSNDGKTLTIKLRQGVKFNDGTPFNAAAVVKTLERDLTLKASARRGDLASVKKVSAPDESTVQLDLSKPDAGLVGQLSDRAGQIMSPAQLDKLGDNFGSGPVCVGPFSFVSRNPGSSIALEKSKDYYDASSVKLNKVTFSIVADDNIRATQLRAGAVQVVDRIPTTAVSELSSGAQVQIVKATSLGFWGLAINVGNQGAGKPFSVRDNPLAQSQAVRKAFELSLDRNTINRVVYNNLFKPDCAPLSPVSPYATQQNCTQRDVAKAQALLASAGVKTPFKIKLSSDNNTQTQRLDQLIQSEAKDAGFDVTIEASDVSSLIAAEKAGTYDVFVLQWSGRVDPNANISPFNATNGSLNYTGASTPLVDSLLDKGTQLTGTDERKPAYDQVTQQLLERINIIYLFHDVYLDGISSKLKGFQLYNDGLPRLKTAYFAS